MRNSSEDKIRIVLIRHGITKCNLQKKYCGKRNNDSLSEAGINALNEKKEEGVYPFCDIVFTSEKIRTIQTANIIYPDINPIKICEFDEIDFGDFEGKSYEELKFDERYQKWIDSDGEDPFPGGDSKASYCERVKGGFLKALDMAGDLRSIGMVVHGGTIMAILSVFAKENYYDCIVSNGSGYICEMIKGKPDSLKILNKI